MNLSPKSMNRKGKLRRFRLQPPLFQIDDNYQRIMSEETIKPVELNDNLQRIELDDNHDPESNLDDILQRIELEDNHEQKSDKKDCPAHIHEYVEDMEIIDNQGKAGRYTGCLSKKTRQPNGDGCMEYYDDNDVERYDGQWVLGDWDGYGQLLQRTATGGTDCYEGGFFDNKKHGNGVTRYSDGKTLEATFVNGHVTGNARMKYADGSSYWGRYNERGLRHGRGKYVYPSGKIYDGEFQNGSIEGHGRMTWPDGHWYLGQFSHGERHGYGLQMEADGNTVFHRGQFLRGRPVRGCQKRRR